MPLTFPRRFTRGQKMTAVDAYGELRIWPDGHFSYAISIRNTDPVNACRVNAGFVLFDRNQALVGTFGMATQEELSVNPWGQHSMDLHGKIPEKALEKTKSVALAFRLASQKFDADKLRDIAGAGLELMLCPSQYY